MKPANVTCPVCRMRWTIETKHSWWLSYTNCYGCMGDATDITERVMANAECELFRTGQLSLLAT